MANFSCTFFNYKPFIDTQWRHKIYRFWSLFMWFKHLSVLIPSRNLKKKDKNKSSQDSFTIFFIIADRFKCFVSILWWFRTIRLHYVTITWIKIVFQTIFLRLFCSFKYWFYFDFLHLFILLWSICNKRPYPCTVYYSTCTIEHHSLTHGS